MGKSKILVTGASGFIGQSLCGVMQRKSIAHVPVTRQSVASMPHALVIENINPSTAWHASLWGIDTVVHLAARVHMLKDLSPDPLRDYRIANVDATLNLARQSGQAGVRRFIYLSSVKVNGESTTARPFFAVDIPCPVDPYGVTKYEAEQGLKNIALETGMELVIIRPPLVYGPGVKANFLQLMCWVKRGIPLPLANIDNRRSMIFIGNLTDLILRCAASDAASGHTFLASDDHDVSIAELVNSISAAMGRPARLFSMPAEALMIAARLIGKTSSAERLLQSLQVDVEFTKRTLGWTPPCSFDVGIERTVRHFLDIGCS